MSQAALRNSGLQAIVFDIDGTLYSQSQLRRAILPRLLTSYVTSPRLGWHTLRAIHAYRRAQEQLRHVTNLSEVAAAQFRLACEATNLDEDFIARSVNEWMSQKPLTFLARCRQPGMVEFLHACKARGLRLGAFSDYPAEAKLRSLGVAELFDVVMSAQDPEVDAVKPHPRGLLLTLSRLGSLPAESLYVGDRLDVDVPTAVAAGVPCVLLTRHRIAGTPNAPVCFASYSELKRLLWDPSAAPQPVS